MCGGGGHQRAAEDCWVAPAFAIAHCTVGAACATLTPAPAVPVRLQSSHAAAAAHQLGRPARRCQAATPKPHLPHTPIAAHCIGCIMASIMGRAHMQFRSTAKHSQGPCMACTSVCHGPIQSWIHDTSFPAHGLSCAKGVSAGTNCCREWRISRCGSQFSDRGIHHLICLQPGCC